MFAPEGIFRDSTDLLKSGKPRRAEQMLPRSTVEQGANCGYIYPVYPTDLGIGHPVDSIPQEKVNAARIQLSGVGAFPKKMRVSWGVDVPPSFYSIPHVILWCAFSEMAGIYTRSIIARVKRKHARYYWPTKLDLQRHPVGGNVTFWHIIQNSVAVGLTTFSPFPALVIWPRSEAAVIEFCEKVYGVLRHPLSYSRTEVVSQCA